MNRGRKIVLSLVTVFFAIQFIQPAKNKNDVDMQADLIPHLKVPEKVATVLQTACYDCHSNNTRYPWYATVQPMGWFLSKHIKKGKEALNLSGFGNFSVRRQQSKIKAMYNSVKDGSMPLTSYVLLHPDAKLTKETRSLVMDWASKTAADLSIKKQAVSSSQ